MVEMAPHKTVAFLITLLSEDETVVEAKTEAEAEAEADLHPPVHGDAELGHLHPQHLVRPLPPPSLASCHCERATWNLSPRYL